MSLAQCDTVGPAHYETPGPTTLGCETRPALRASLGAPVSVAPICDSDNRRARDRALSGAARARTSAPTRRISPQPHLEGVARRPPRAAPRSHPPSAARAAAEQFAGRMPADSTRRHGLGGSASRLPTDAMCFTAAGRMY